MPMKRIEALDLARVIAMLAVIMIHVTSTFISAESDFTFLGMNLAFLLNQAARFAVPLFILLSGMSLSLSKSSQRATAFWRSRLVKLGIPYLLWSFIYSLYDHGFSLKSYIESVMLHPAAVIRSLLLGQAAPQLYFVIVLMQLYLLYPAIRSPLRRQPTLSVAAFALTLFVQCQYIWQRRGIAPIPAAIRPYLWLLFPTWIFYFVLGAAFTREGVERLCAFASRHVLPIVGSTVAFSVLFATCSQRTQDLGSVKPSLNVYTVLVLLSALGIWSRIETIHCLRAAVSFLARHSMSIYFCHVLVLRCFQHFPHLLSGTAGMCALYALVLAGSVLCSVVIDWRPWAVSAPPPQTPSKSEAEPPSHE